jgi:hypothetical protein
MAKHLYDQGAENGILVLKWNEEKVLQKPSNMELRNFSSHKTPNRCSRTER